MKQAILRPAQRAKQLTSTSWRDEYGYAREAWCCCQISYSSCNAYKYILQPVSLLCGPLPVVSTTSWLPVLSGSSSPTRAFANDNSLVLSLLADTSCILKHDLGLISYVRDTAIEDLEFSNHLRKGRCKEEVTKEGDQERIRKWRMRNSQGFWTPSK